MTVIDVTDKTFEAEVLERSRTVPVVVDFWAAWCGPCRTLGPMLEQAVSARGGEVVLAKVDTDANQGLASAFRIQGIPAVKAFRDGRVVDEFTGAIPPGAIEAFLDRIVPSEADRLVSRGDASLGSDRAAAQDAYEAALALEPGHLGAAVGLANLVAVDDPDRARALVSPHRPDPRVEAILIRLDLAAAADGDEAELRRRVQADPSDGPAQLALGRLLAAAGNYDEGFPALLAAVRAGGDERHTAREQLVALFAVLGPDDPLVRSTRPQLAAALY